MSGRDHVEQGVRSCLGILRLATRYPSEQLEAACVRAMSAGASSSGFVEHVLKSGLPLVDPVADDIDVTGDLIDSTLGWAAWIHAARRAGQISKVR